MRTINVNSIMSIFNDGKSRRHSVLLDKMTNEEFTNHIQSKFSDTIETLELFAEGVLNSPDRNVIYTQTQLDLAAQLLEIVSAYKAAPHLKP